MSFQVNLAPSMVAQLAKSAEGTEGAEATEEAVPEGRKREDWRKLKELEEARKAGTAPAMQDEEGKDINPHIPQYIMQAPWYYGAMTPTLRHQRVQEEQQRSFAGPAAWFKKGVKEGSVATKFRKGSCENCGSMTHKKKDCVERPRKIGAKYTGQDLGPDEHIQPDLSFDYVGKRDRWNGYDPAEHKTIVEEYQKVEEAKRQLKAEHLDDAVRSGELAPEEAEKVANDEEEDDEDKYADDVDMPGQKFESKQRITVRNLRIREDTAKYLHNLDVNSAYYDPKTRSMRENPFQNTGKEEAELPYAGDNFVRWSGDSMEMAKKQVFAWEAYEKGAEVHLQADPTKLDILTKAYKQKKEDYKANVQDSILEKYGGAEHLEAPPKQLLLAQSEDYVEYSRQGTVIKGQEKAWIKSRYEEDVYLNNHSSVWGSFWKDGRWGFNCCHSFIKESYCTGRAGKVAEQTSLPGMEEAGTSAATQRLQPEEGDVVAPAPLVPINLTEEERLMIQLCQEKIQKAKEKRRKKKEKKKKRKKKKVPTATLR